MAPRLCAVLLVGLLGLVVASGSAAAAKAEQPSGAQQSPRAADGNNTLAATAPTNTSRHFAKTGNSSSSRSSTKVTLGEDMVLLDERPHTANKQQPKAKQQPQRVQRMTPAQRRAVQRRTRKQRTMGRKGGAGFRQAAPGPFPDDYLLPGCRPGLGTICSDNDVLGLLTALPAEISLDEAYPFVEVAPTGELKGSTESTADVGGGTYSTETTAGATGGLNVIAGDQQVRTNTELSNTLGSAELDASRIDRVIPESISATADSTDATGTYEWRTTRPRYTYVFGQNFGFPNGLATVTDEITGRH